MRKVSGEGSVPLAGLFAMHKKEDALASILCESVFDRIEIT